MESAWLQFLHRLASPDLTFTYDEVCGWSEEEFDALLHAGLLDEVASVKRVICDACAGMHWEKVHWNGDGSQAFIVCPENGIVDVDLERLRGWEVRPAQLAAALARNLGPKESVQPLPGPRLWSLGRRSVAGHSRAFFLAAVGPDDLLDALKAIRSSHGRLTSVLWVPFPPPDGVESGNVTLVDLGMTTSVQDGEVVIDHEYIEGLFFGSRSPNRTSKRQKPLEAHRLHLLKAYGEKLGIDDMVTLGRQLGASKTALHGMARGDRKRYGESKLESVLAKIGCSRAEWDQDPEPANGR